MRWKTSSRRGPHLFEPGGGAGVGGLDAGIEDRHRLLAAPSPTLVELAAADDDRLFDRRQRRFELGGEQLRLGLDAADDVAAALGQRRFEARHAVAHQVVDGSRMSRQRQLDQGLVGGDRRLQLAAMLNCAFVEARLVLVHPQIEIRLVFGQARVEPLRAGGQDRVDRFDLAGQRLAEARLVFGQAGVEPLRAGGHDRVDRLDAPGQRLAEARLVLGQARV